MALYALLRGASTSITPLNLRAVRSGRALLGLNDAGQFAESIGSNPIFQRCQGTPILQLCTASTVSTKKKKKKRTMRQRLQSGDECDSNLIRILDSEIKLALDSDLIDIGVDVPSGFPFKVEDNGGGRTIVLRREFEEESLRIEVHMPSAVLKDDAPTLDEGERETIEPTIPLVVTVSKANGSFLLVFRATASPDRISIHDLSLWNPGSSEDHGYAYRGPPCFLHLKENLRNAFHNYLEIRGLTSSTANFLLEYMMSKDAKEYLRWLRSLKKKLVVH